MFRRESQIGRDLQPSNLVPDLQELLARVPIFGLQVLDLVCGLRLLCGDFVSLCLSDLGVGLQLSCLDLRLLDQALGRCFLRCQLGTPVLRGRQTFGLRHKVGVYRFSAFPVLRRDYPPVSVLL